MAVGGPACVVGLVTATAGFWRGFGGNGEGSDLILGSGVTLAVTGFIAFNVGIPFKVSGDIKRKKNRKAMEQVWPERKSGNNLLTMGMTSNGVGLTFQF